MYARFYLYFSKNLLKVEVFFFSLISFVFFIKKEVGCDLMRAWTVLAYLLPMSDGIFDTYLIIPLFGKQKIPRKITIIFF